MNVGRLKFKCMNDIRFLVCTTLFYYIITCINKIITVTTDITTTCFDLCRSFSGYAKCKELCNERHMFVLPCVVHEIQADAAVLRHSGLSNFCSF